ncbi:MAG: tRNA pseudouridine(55) synthase TruB [Acholeplasmataceae bacterium]
MDGFLLIDKPVGISSHDVVYQVKKKLKVNKVGHTGTLDPFASGLLILCVGKATKLAQLFSDLDKAYSGTILFNKLYDTYDVTGKLIEEKQVELSSDLIQSKSKEMIGTYDQLPPMYSAIKIDGKKLYDLARQGIELERPKRKVSIFDFQVHDFNDDKSTFYAHVSKGTYIRSLAVDFAQKLGTVAVLETLRRESVGSYDVKHAISIQEVEKNDIISVESYFKAYQKLMLSDYLVHLVKNGVYLDERQIETDQPFIVVDQQNQMIAYYEVIDKNKYKPVYIF